MAKINDQLIYVCSNCGEEYLKWQGKCENCGSWNSLKEFHVSKQSKVSGGSTSEPVLLKDVRRSKNERIKTKIEEFDRVLGGGIVGGSVILLGGDPGIGKSTLLLHVASCLGNSLYISGEESLEQIKMRFDRLSIRNSKMKILSEINLDSILSVIEKEKPNVVIIDSIQTVYCPDYPSTPGSIVQVRECALRLQQSAKNLGIPIILVGHVTKEGSVAGPRTLEHMVDVVLYLEGERFLNNRILRGAKNRFGATDEIGIFEMGEGGMEEVKNPSKLFLEEHRKNVPGTVVAATIEGTRSFLVEIQALATTTNFGYPQRRSSGFDPNRLQLLIAVLQKRANLNLSNQDIFVNVVGGMKINEPAVDLAVAMAVAGSFKNMAYHSKLCVFGEVGLSGEIRKVQMESKRLVEAKRLGFDRFVKQNSLLDSIQSNLIIQKGE